MHPKANFTLFHFVIFSEVESDFPYLSRFSSYGAMFEHHFWAKTPILGHFGHYLTHLPHNLAGIVDFAGDLSLGVRPDLPTKFNAQLEVF